MNTHFSKKISYFPGCSLATTARENNQSLHLFLEYHQIYLEELEDWSCCGSSSAHSIDKSLGKYLPARNLAMAPPDRPLLAACPSCYQNLKLTHQYFKQNPDARKQYQKIWEKPFNQDLEIITFFDLLSEIVERGAFQAQNKRLNGLRVAPYYGCMLTRPPSMREERNFYGLMEIVISAIGGSPLKWNQATKCCGTYLSVARPDIASINIQKIISEAENLKSDCIVTACAMCQLNLEIRGKSPGKLPVLHLSELLSLSEGFGADLGWFKRHLIDPRPMLQSKRLIA